MVEELGKQYALSISGGGGSPKNSQLAASHIQNANTKDFETYLISALNDSLLKKSKH